MKKLLALLLFAPAVQAAPFFTADVDAATARCGIYVNADARVFTSAITVAVSPARPTGKYCEFDVGTYPNGAHVIAATAVSVTDVLGQFTESLKTANIPFTLPMPAAPTAPGVPQNPKLKATSG